jgi:hypothetical protein
MNRMTVALSFGALALASPALAEPIHFTAFGHTFEIAGDAFEEELVLDGTKVHENGMIFFDAIGLVGTTPVIVGTSATGGNMCGDAPFVVSFPADGPPVFEGPIETCAFLQPVFAEGALLFRGTANALNPGEQWSWQPGMGFTEEQPIAFVPSAESGWNALLRREVTHPFDLLGYADTLTQAEVLMGNAKNDVLLALSGPGSGEFHGELYGGDACFPHNCPYSQALIVADGLTRTLYMAWRIDGGETIAPAIGNWPKAAEQQLRAWETRLVP